MTAPVTTGFRIRHQKLPERCEVCHQKDQFDPHTGVCLRCNHTDGAQFLLNPRQLAVPEQFRQILAEELSQEEWLIWVGTPNLARVSKQSWIYMGINAGMTVMMVILLGYWYAQGTLIWPFSLGLLFFVVQWIGTTLRDWEKAHHTVHAITNLRVLTMVDGWKIEATCRYPEAMTRLSLVENADGTGDVIFDAARKWGRVNRFGFLGIDEPVLVRQLVCEHLLSQTELPAWLSP